MTEHMKQLVKIIFLSTSILMALSFSACSTVEGMGKDMQQLGKSIESAAKKNDSGSQAPTQAPATPKSDAVVTPIN